MSVPHVSTLFQHEDSLVAPSRDGDRRRCVDGGPRRGAGRGDRNALHPAPGTDTHDAVEDVHRPDRHGTAWMIETFTSAEAEAGPPSRKPEPTLPRPPAVRRARRSRGPPSRKPERTLPRPPGGRIESRVRESNPRPHDYKSRLERPARVASCRRVASDLGFRDPAVRLVLARISLWWAVRGQSVGTERLPLPSANRGSTGVTARP